MHFDLGWVSVFIVILLLNIYLIYHFFVIPFKSRKALKRGILVFVYAFFAMFGILYFRLFFFGETGTDFMNGLMYVAAIYLSMLFYSVGFFFIYDIIRIINHFKKFPEKLRYHAGKFFYGGLTIFIICALITASGLYPAWNIKTTEYETTVAQKSSSIEKLNIVAFSDAHTGVTVRKEQLVEIKDRVMAMDPDIILIVGDIFDEGTTDELKEYTLKVFSELDAPYGVYFVLGNHDDYTGNTDKQIKYFTDANIKVLRNEVVNIDGLFYLAGRDDQNQTRKPYSVIEDQITEDFPVIVMDHRPDPKEVSASEKADIQLSGHTHNGQIFPAQTFDLFDFGLSYGLHTRGNCQILVSSGVGNYGIPLRIGSPCEIVDLDLTFK